jgi:uncharacterized membrane protein
MQIKLVHLFPLILIACDLGAAVVYGVITGEWRKIIYWLAAAALTWVVTF